MTNPTEARDPRLIEAEAAKIQAETRKTNLEADELELQLTLRKAEIDLKVAEAAKAASAAAYSQIQTEAYHRNETFTRMGNHFFHHYILAGQIDEDRVDPLLGQMAVWHRMDPKCPMNIEINSPGGYVIDGMHLFDQIHAYSLRGGGEHEITMTIRGMAASMAGILVQAADHRVIGARSTLMIHELAGGAVGKIGEIKDTVKWFEKISDDIAKVYVERSGGKTSLATFKRNWKDREWYLSAAEALKHGFVDRIEGVVVE